MRQPASASQGVTARAGVKDRLRGRTLAQWYCLAVAVLLGVRGATTLLFGASFDQPGTGWRAIQQLAVAAVLIAAQRSSSRAYRVLVPFALFYLVLWVVGIVNGHEAFGLIPINMRDKILYIAYAVVAALILVLPSQRPRHD